MAARKDQEKSRQPRKRSAFLAAPVKEKIAAKRRFGKPTAKAAVKRVTVKKTSAKRVPAQTNRVPSTAEIEKRGRSWSKKLMDRIVAQYGNDQFVAFEINSGAYVVAATKLELMHKFEKQFGDEWGWIERVGTKGDR